MKVNLHNVGFTVDQKLVDFIQKKMDKLDLFYDRVIDAEVNPIERFLKKYKEIR